MEREKFIQIAIDQGVLYVLTNHGNVLTFSEKGWEEIEKPEKVDYQKKIEAIKQSKNDTRNS